MRKKKVTEITLKAMKHIENEILSTLSTYIVKTFLLNHAGDSWLNYRTLIWGVLLLLLLFSCIVF